MPKKQPFEYYYQVIKSKNPKITVINPEDFKNCESVLIWKEDGIEQLFKRSVVKMFHRSPFHPNTYKERMKKTFMQKYGVDNPLKNKEIYEKSVKSLKKNIRYVKHWKTGESITCRGGYEYATVAYFNSKKIDYLCQIPFVTPNNTVYYVDFYLKDIDLYIEVKGNWINPEISKKKWEWFHNQYPNSEIWFKQDLRNKGIINSRGDSLYHTEEYENKRRKKGWHKITKVKCVETGVIYDSVKDASIAAGVTSSTMSANLSKKTKRCANLTWIYHSEEKIR